MAITFVGLTETTVTGDDVVTMPVPTGTVPGDLMVVSTVSTGSVDDGSIGIFHTGGSGYIVRATWESRFNYLHVAFAPDPVPASYTWSVGAISTTASVMLSFRGVHHAPADAGNEAVEDFTSTSPGSTTSVAIGSITTTTDGCMLVACASSSLNTITWTAPGSMTEQWDYGVGSGGGVSSGGATEELGTAGATGTRTFTASATGNKAGVILALRPAGAWHVGYVGP